MAWGGGQSSRHDGRAHRGDPPRRRGGRAAVALARPGGAAVLRSGRSGLFRRRELKTTTLADRGRAWLAFQRGAVDEAVAWACQAHAASWDRADIALWAGPAAHDLARFGRPELAVDRVAAAQKRLQSRFSTALLAQTRALADADGPALVAAAEALAACDAHGLAAEGLAWAADLAPDSSTAAAWRERAADWLGESLLRSPIIVALLAAQPAAMDGLALLDGGPIPIGIERAAKGWRVRFQGTELVLGDRVGFAYLAALVTSPGREVRADVLAAGGGQPAAQSRQVVLDRTGRATLEGEAHRVVEALRRARRSGPARHVEELEQQAEALAAELARHGSFRGAARAFVDDNERARTAVRKAILRAVTDIEEVHPAAAQYLRSRLSTGSSCIFRP